jgi:hypothetical protein
MDSFIQGCAHLSNISIANQHPQRLRPPPTGDLCFCLTEPKEKAQIPGSRGDNLGLFGLAWGSYLVLEVSKIVEGGNLAEI